MPVTTEAHNEANPCEASPCRAPNAPTYFCINCCSWYCAIDWDVQQPHKPGKAVGGRKHEQVERDVYYRLHPLLEPPKTREELIKLHQDDHNTIWFGVSPSNLRGFSDYGRYSKLMVDSQPSNGEVQYPQLVSFIGQTSEYPTSVVLAVADLSCRCRKEHPGQIARRI
jgi:hypothetical protein